MKRITQLPAALALAILGGIASIGNLAAPAPLAAEASLTAEAILQKSKDRIQVDSTSTRASMLITDKDGSSSERLLDQYSSRKDGLERAVIVFQKPAAVANTRFLVLENKGRAEDRWIFLPALGKSRRVASGEGSGSFVGTDFSYDDISSLGRDVSKDEHVLLRQESLAGEECWVIESKPKDSSYQYSKSVRWISKSSYIALKIELYDKQGKLFKLLEMGQIEAVQGILTPRMTKMSNLQSGSSTVIHVQIIKYNDKIPDSVFTERFLTTGRP